MVNLVAGARYIITNAKGGTVLDLSGSDNRSVIGWPRHGGENQQWELIEIDGGWHIRNIAQGLYLGLDGEARDDTRVIASEYPFLWHIWEDDENPSTLRVCVPDTRQNIDLTNFGDSEPGTPVAIWGRWEGRNQAWSFEEV